MRKTTKAILGLSALLGATLALGACSYPHAPYDDLAGQDFGVSVRFDRNGGVFSSTEGVDLVDVYPTSKLENGIKLVEPGDSRRQEQASTSTATRSGYFLAGWYRERTLRTDAQGNAVDDYGELCSVSGRPQGYVYGGKWDFAKDYLHTADVTPVEASKGSKGTQYEVTLYAGWVPNFIYKFYRPAEEGESGWQEYGEYTINPAVATSIPLPAWNETSGRMDYGNVPVYSGHTVTGLYADAAMTKSFTEDIDHAGKIDFETATAEGFELAVYTTWRVGTWFHITRPEQIVSNAAVDACFEITADLDFAGVTSEWPLANLAYSGTFDGQGHTIKNIKATQFESSTTAGGAFGELTAASTVRNVTFEGVTFNLQRGTRQTSGPYGTGGLYGLFAGRIDEQATVENVAVSGTLHLGDLIDVPDASQKTGTFWNYEIGLVSGNLVEKGISRENIKVQCDQVPTGYNIDGSAVMGYPVKAKAESDGSVTVTVNEDKTVDPNL